MNDNRIIEREKPNIDKICEEYHYDSNIRHLLYIIIPAFIIKYGPSYEKLIIDTFKNTIIISSNKESKRVLAYFSSTPKIVNNEYQTNKYMVIENYNKISLVSLLDNLVHEFNHAINSYNNEIKITNKYLLLRTGLTYKIYNKDNLKFIKKADSYILEEIINTKQTEDIINIIKNFKLENKELNTTIYAINSETNHIYNSNSYYLQSYICKKILVNKTFIRTLEKLRLTGDIYDIDNWFDNITGIKESYKELIKLLLEIYDLEIEYSTRKYFKKLTLNKIKDHSNRIMNIINNFDNNVNFK